MSTESLDQRTSAPKCACTCCGSVYSTVHDGRYSLTRQSYRRVRICRDCKTRYVTIEQVIPSKRVGPKK